MRLWKGELTVWTAFLYPQIIRSMFSTHQAQQVDPISTSVPILNYGDDFGSGFPKGVVRSTGGHAVVLPWSFKAIFAMQRGDIWWGASDLGWVVGHSYICYGPFLSRLTTVLYEGKPVGTPDAGQFYRWEEKRPNYLKSTRP